MSVSVISGSTCDVKGEGREIRELHRILRLFLRPLRHNTPILYIRGFGFKSLSGYRLSRSQIFVLFLTPNRQRYAMTDSSHVLPTSILIPTLCRLQHHPASTTECTMQNILKYMNRNPYVNFTTKKLRVISDFRREADKNCALLG
jgi:hypothetical protein